MEILKTNGQIGWINKSISKRLKLLIYESVSLLKGMPKKIETVKKNVE